MYFKTKTFESLTISDKLLMIMNFIIALSLTVLSKILKPRFPMPKVIWLMLKPVI